MLSNLISQPFCFCFRNCNLVKLSLHILLFVTLFVYFYSFFIVTPFTVVVLYTLFHLYSVFKGCLKVMNSFKLIYIFLCFGVDVLSEQYMSISRLLFLDFINF